MTVYQRLRQYLHDNGIKQSWLANKIGMKRSSMSLKMTGKVEFSIEEISHICGVLKLPIETMIVPYPPDASLISSTNEDASKTA